MIEWRDEYQSETRKYVGKYSSSGGVTRFMEWLQEKTNYTVNRMVYDRMITPFEFWSDWHIVCDEDEAMTVKLTWC